eukprot:6489613-Amphidinium_carterae.1
MAQQDFCRTNHLSQVVRSHQLPGHLGFPGEGQCTLHSDRCRTVSPLEAIYVYTHVEANPI